MTKIVTITEAQAQLSELLSFAMKGNEVIITKDNKPLARLVPVLSSKQSRVPGLHRGKIWVSDDFDEPLGEKFWLGSK